MTQSDDTHDLQGMTDPNPIPAATPTSPPTALPRPAVSASNAQLKFVPADAGEAPTFEPLPPDIGNADISIAREFLSSFADPKLTSFSGRKLRRDIVRRSRQGAQAKV